MTDSLLARFQGKTAVRFLIVGVSAAILYFVLFSLFYIYYDYFAFVATFFAYSISFGCAYLAHKFWTYQSSSVPVSQSLPRYFILQLLSVVATSIVTQVSVTFIGLESFLVSVVATLFAGVFNYIFSTLWVFSGVEKTAK